MSGLRGRIDPLRLRERVEALRSRRAGGRSALVIAVVLVLVISLGTTAVLAGPGLLRWFGLASSDTENVPPPPRLALGPLGPDAPVPTKAGVSAALNKLATSDALGNLTGVVLNPADDQVLWSRNPDKAMQPGSAAKLLTSTAALLTLDPTMRIKTRVVAGPTPDSVVLVGGGDPTLSVLPKDPGNGADSVYPGAAKLDNLAEEVRNSHPGAIHSVTVDVSRFTGDGMAQGWETSDIAGGNITPIEPLILDGGRTKPDELDPPRTADPALDAGRALAQRLGADPATVAVGTAPAAAAVLGEVASPPVNDLVENALRISDNVLAESLARQVALARGADPSFVGAAGAVKDTLAAGGFDVRGVTTVDGSGLSTDDLVPARLLGEIMAVAGGPASDKRALRLRPLLSGLPVAGGDGTLNDRFGAADSTSGRGFVRAKTGTLTGVSTLAGLVTDSDGRLLTFALMANGTSPAQSRPRLDAIAAALRECGCR
ncbi:MAG TPA: D-alanyl-D-alanine carboxypeptidase/D-alanyl-D-alanine-endopeptidase [Pseudonocardia sp.]|nr:D-alanyl-D-alanine carboxypeptidase/D-alanyl-D-alanine-endopeptidase [Pseudonocardia sp.]